MWHKGSQYLKKMGGVILVAVIFIWALGYFPRNVKYTQNYDELIQTEVTKLQNEKLSTTSNDQEVDSINKIIRLYEVEKEYERQANSYLGKIGKFIEPAIAPLGFDWKMGVSLLSGVAAKEIVVSTLGVLYQADEGSTNNTLAEKLRAETHKTGELKGQKTFTPLKAIAFLIFILIYFPCVAVISAISHESGSWKWALFTIVFTTSLAWIVAFSIYQVGMIIGG